MHRHGNAVAKRHVADFVGAENSPRPCNVTHLARAVYILVCIDSNNSAGTGARLNDNGVSHVGDFESRRTGLRLTFLIAPAALAFLNACGRRPPANSIAEDLSMLRRLNFTRSRLNTFPSPFQTIFLLRANNCCWLVAHEATLPPRRRSLRRHTAVFRTDFYSSRTYAHRKSVSMTLLSRGWSRSPTYERSKTDIGLLLRGPLNDGRALGAHAYSLGVSALLRFTAPVADRPVLIETDIF